MFGSYILNRQRITGKLNEHTPSAVVIETLKAQAICISKTINTLEENIKEIERINGYRILTLKEPLSDKDLRYLASFVNYDCKTWTKTSLINAYEHMMNFDVKKITHIVYGQKTYDNIEVYNNCMLYSVCREYNIDTKWNMTTIEMLNSIEKMTLTLSSLQEQLNSFVCKASKNQIINLINSVIRSQNNKQDNIDEINSNITPTSVPPILDICPIKINESLDRYKNTSYLLSRVNPLSHYDAIILSALTYNINITESSFPFEEFKQIRKAKDIKFYSPVDKTFRERYTKNSMWYDLTIHWEPKLNNIYDMEGLKKLCIYEGFTVDDFRGYRFDSLLQISRISQNIFFGKNVYTDEEYTPILLEDIKDLDNSQCITLGNLETKDLTTFSLNELINHFSNFKEYKHPLKLNEVLDSRIVSKLKVYATNVKNEKLLKVIDEVEKWKSYSNEFTDKLRDEYIKNKDITVILYKILECGMYMRGWKVCSDTYPLASKSTNHDEGIQYQIEQNVHSSIDEVFNTLLLYDDSVKNIVNILPLMKYTVNEKTNERHFIITPDPEDGKSILERLQFVKSGDKHKNMKSCIRLSSNIVLTSIYYYICSLGLFEPFRLEELEYIS